MSGVVVAVAASVIGTIKKIIEEPSNMKIDKRIVLNDAVESMGDGASILIGGWGPIRKPMSLVSTIAKSSLKNLTILSCAGMDMDILIGAGKVKTAIFGFDSFEGAPGAPVHFRRARQEGTVEIRELSEYMFVAQFKAAAERLPFYPTRSGIGTDILSVNPQIKTIMDPYTDQPLVAVPAFTPDFALIHVNEADEIGNARIIGDPYMDNLFARAADKVIVTAERIVRVGEIQESNILSCWVDMVVESPRAAYPGECYPDYGISEKGFREYSNAAKDGDSFGDFLEKLSQGGRE